jgi:hypothetical protein
MISSSENYAASITAARGLTVVFRFWNNVNNPENTKTYNS